MGKVIINEHNANPTASKQSLSNESSNDSDSRSRIIISRSNSAAQDVGAKMNNKSKHVAESAKDESKPVVTKMEKPEAKKAEKPEAKKTQISKPALPANNKTVMRLGSGEKKPQTSGQVKIVETTKVSPKPKSKLDPELALLANRTSSAEKVRPAMHKTGRSISGMTSASVRRPGVASASVHAQTAANAVRSQSEQPKKEDLRFTKFKSVLIGIGAAVVVAVIGFACIGIFGSHKNMCTVLFESNGGSKVEAEEIVCGRTVKRPADPTKEGFEFQGWTYEGDEFDFDNTTLFKNSTLVAKWQAKEGVEIVKVTFDTDGGSAVQAIEMSKGGKLEHVAVPTKPGYVFEDWYLDDKPFDFDQPVEKDITLKATWTKQPANNNASNNSSTPTPVKVSDITLSNYNLTIEVGQSGTVSAKVLPSSANYNLSTISYSSDVATCDVNGKNNIVCTAKAGGTAKIRVRDTNSGVATILTVTVPMNDVPPVTEPENPSTSNPGSSGGTTTPGDDQSSSGGNSLSGGNTSSGDDGNTENPGNQGESTENPPEGSGNEEQKPTEPSGDGGGQDSTTDNNGA